MKKKFSSIEIENKAKEIRKCVLRMISEAGSGHTGGSLGLADVMAYLYFKEMKHDPKNAKSEDRDRLILSIGHVAPVLYASLAEAGYFEKEELMSLRKLGSRLQGHPGRDHGLPGLELSAGSLGQGLSVAVGIALANKIDNRNSRVFCLLGDGELQEGAIWEAAMSAGHHQLNNLIGIVDRNNLQIDGSTEKVMKLEPLVDKWKAFNWEVFECNGNDILELESVFKQIEKNSQKPSIIIAHTLMGKGVKSIEGDYTWHGKAPSKSELYDFLLELGS
ncbi:MULTISPECIES: transketolase [unclassified Lentimicrobium]|uniref:transketolase n=1 Tax=unclassified Lentimicrobium TaxID=2677434 RepID=UPI0015568B93|nr:MULTISPECIES: transketolase [unclassified Lentimicrobium]NPD46717.1 transketolase [Lentimicrobium sp. S6]NPD85507.1 transketolase [Lentimicrobium sp. L6]